MNILHVIPSLAPQDGGSAVAAINMCRELSHRGHKVTIYTSAGRVGTRWESQTDAQMNVRGANVKYFPGGKLNYYAISPPFATALRRDIPGYDVVHIHSLYLPPSILAAYYSRRFGIPYVRQPHGALDPFIFRRHRARKWLYEALFERRNLRCAAAVLFTTRDEMKLAKSTGLRFRGFVAPLGVEFEDAPDDWQQIVNATWPELAGKEVILFLGRINFKKGLDVLARAFSTIHGQRKDAHLVIAGPDNEGYGDQVRRWLAKENWLGSVTFTGMVQGGLKAALLKRARVFVLPSYTENFGIAVVEAMAAGLPVMISNKVNIWREIDKAGAGLVVNPNAHEVASAILKLLEDPVLAKQMGERGRHLVQERFTWDNAGQMLLKLYQTIVAEYVPPIQA